MLIIVQNNLLGVTFKIIGFIESLIDDHRMWNNFLNFNSGISSRFCHDFNLKVRMALDPKYK